MVTPKNTSPTPETSGDWASREHRHALVLFAVTALALYLCFRITAPFLTAIAASMSLAVVVVPVQRWLEAKFRRPGLAALLTVGLVLIVIFLPLAFLTERLVSEAADGTAALKSKL